MMMGVEVESMICTLLRYVIMLTNIQQNHFGGLNGGHYTAQVKNPYKQTWLNFDDSRISGSDSVSNEAAYIAFYVQQSRAGIDLVKGKWWQ
jgi:ubiquitin C-terminal hydrolase